MIFVFGCRKIEILIFLSTIHTCLFLEEFNDELRHLQEQKNFRNFVNVMLGTGSTPPQFKIDHEKNNNLLLAVCSRMRMKYQVSLAPISLPYSNQKSLTQEVCQKRDSSDRRSKGCSLQPLYCLQYGRSVTVRLLEVILHQK